jgi:hypothetical protein
MAKKETTKKKTTKKSTTKKSVIKEVAEKIIESQEKVELVEQDPPIEQEYLDAIAENMATAEIMNGDPSVIIPSNDIELKKVDDIEEAAFKETFKNVKLENKKSRKIDSMFGYSWNGVEIDY